MWTMRRVRKRQVQLALLTQDGLRPRSNKGGKRPGAGRPPKNGRAGTSHARRPDIKPAVPIHVVFRIESDIGSLRRRDIYEALRGATIVAGNHQDVRIVHMSIQRNHLHLYVEADNRAALTRGMKSFAVSAAKRINASIVVDGKHRRGRVFSDRYHIEVVTNCRQAHRVLGYILNNWRKHREDFDRKAQEWMIDPFSSASSFDGWKERDQIPPWPVSYRPLFVRPARSWLLRVGWKKYGPISCFEIPSRVTGNSRR